MAVNISQIGSATLLIFSMVSVASADTFYVAIERKDAVSLVNVTSLEKTGGTASLWTLTVKDPAYFSTPSGRVAFATAREDYRCGADSYDIPVFKEFSKSGQDRGATENRDPQGRYSIKIIEGTAEEYFFHAMCQADQSTNIVAGLDQRKLIDAPTNLVAYRRARRLMNHPSAVPLRLENDNGG